MNDVQINVFHFILVASHWYQRLKLNFHRKRVNMIILCPLSFKNPPLRRYLAIRAYQVRTHPSANITFARVALVPRYGVRLFGPTKALQARRRRSRLSRVRNNIVCRTK